MEFYLSKENLQASNPANENSWWIYTSPFHDLVEMYRGAIHSSDRLHSDNSCFSPEQPQSKKVNLVAFDANSTTSDHFIWINSICKEKRYPSESSFWQICCPVTFVPFHNVQYIFLVGEMVLLRCHLKYKCHWNFHSLMVRVKNGTVTLESISGVPQNVKHRTTTYTSRRPPKMEA